MNASTGTPSARRRSSALDIWLFAAFGAGLVSYAACWLGVTALSNPESEGMANFLLFIWIIAFVVQCLCARSADTNSHWLETDNGTTLFVAVVSSALVCGMIVNVVYGQRYGKLWYTDWSAWLGAVFLAVHVVCLWRSRRWQTD